MSGNGRATGGGYVYRGSQPVEPPVAEEWADYERRNRRANDAYDTDRIVDGGNNSVKRLLCERDSIDRRYGAGVECGPGSADD